MSSIVKIRKQMSCVDKEELRKKSTEELVDKIQTLTAHNQQLKNIINRDSKGAKKRKYKSNPFDFSKCTFRHILLKLYYLGWDYNGFIVQEDTTNTVEHHLFQAFIKTCLIKDRASSNYHRCGRTDKGVSSFSQTISIDLRSKLRPEDQGNLSEEIHYCKLLNKVLPDNIQCTAWSPVAISLSARFDCRGRTYKYFFPKGHLNIGCMKVGAQYFLGVHDFRNFCKMDVGNGVVQFTRNITDIGIDILSENDEINEYSMYVLTIKGKAFLWHQIRCIMAVLLLIGCEKESPEIIKDLLDIDRHPRKPDYNLASEIPLNLYDCNYDLEQPWYYDNVSLNLTMNKLRASWTETNIKSAMMKSMIQDLERVQRDLPEDDNVGNSTHFLLQGVKPKNYMPLIKRPKCESLEGKIAHYVKRSRIELKEDSS